MQKWYFNPRSPCGERQTASTSSGVSQDFNPRSPCGERPPLRSVFATDGVFQSTLPVWGATPGILGALIWQRFQSTLPVWGATSPPTPRNASKQNFNPRSPCGERRLCSGDSGACSSYFNPRSPCGERRRGNRLAVIFSEFQSTLPVWGATSGRETRENKTDISIHAPRVGSDDSWKIKYDAIKEISIHAPRVGSDAGAAACRCDMRISIHAPRVGSDNLRPLFQRHAAYFNPRSPCGERRTGRLESLVVVNEISIHAPRVGSDGCGRSCRRTG